MLTETLHFPGSGVPGDCKIPDISAKKLNSVHHKTRALSFRTVSLALESCISTENLAGSEYGLCFGGANTL